MTDKIIQELEKRHQELQERAIKYNCGFPIGNSQPKFFLINIEIISNFFKWIQDKQIRLDICNHKEKGLLFTIFSKEEYQHKSITNQEKAKLVELIYQSESIK